MPRCAKRTSLTRWLDAEYRKIDPELRHVNLVIDAAEWVVDLLRQEGCKEYYSVNQVRLPCGKAVRGGWSLPDDDTSKASVYLSGGRCEVWDLSRFWPRAKQVARGRLRAVASATSFVTMEGLSSTYGRPLGASDQVLRPRRPAGRTIVQRFTGGRFGSGVFQWAPRRQGRT